MRPTRPTSRGPAVLLPVLALLLAATTGLVVYALDTSQDLDEQGVRLQCTLRAVAARRTRAASTTRGALIQEPVTQADARSMIRFCDRASAGQRNALRETALQAKDPLAAANAVRALGRLGAVLGDAELVALLRDPRERVRDETILALGEGRDEAAVALLAPLAQGDDPKVRTLAIRAIGRAGGGQAESALADVLRRPSATREELAFARAALGGRVR